VEAPEAGTLSGPRWPSWAWPVLAAVASLLAIPGVFTLSRVFFVRDLTTTFLPHHLWFHDSLLAGNAPIWNPLPGFGCSTVGDANFQTLFPLTLPLRLLPPTLGFNWIVALPFPLAALGMYWLLRTRVTAMAACLGAITVAASGAFLSTANTPNLAWSAALIPWVLLATNRLAARPSPSSVALLAATFALMFLAGEPVTFAATAVLALGYATLSGAAGGAGWRAVRTAGLATLAALACGVLLSAVQLLPLLDLHSRSIRASGSLIDMWSLHPARLVELVAPWFFGKWVGTPDQITRWLLAVNDGREPLLLSLYCGVFALLLAALGIASRRLHRGAVFWCAVLIGGLVAALGTHTPVHSAAQRALPILANLRFPSKNFVFVALAVGALAAFGFDELARGAVPRRKRMAPLLLAGACCAVAATGVVLAFALPESGLALCERLAHAAAIPDPASAARSFLARAGSGSVRLLVLSPVVGATFLLAARPVPNARFARGALFVLLAGDLIVTNASINPTIEAEAIAPFEWVAATAAHPHDRVYVARDFGPGLAKLDDAVPSPAFSMDDSPTVQQAIFDTAVCDYWTCPGVRTTLARDLTGLRPREYLALLQAFSESARDARYRFLSWSGTRYYLTSAPPPLPSTALTRLPKLGTTALYESAPAGARVAVLTNAVVEPDADAQIARLFDPAFDPARTVVIDREPATASGRRGDPARAAVSISNESNSTIVVHAGAAEDSYLLLLDAYDPGWTVKVDGEPATLLRADGVFRAVRIPPGQHEIRFSYLPRALVLGGAMSLLTGIVLLSIAFVPRFHKR